MTDRSQRRTDSRARWRWTIWVCFLLLWSVALLTPDPIGFLLRRAPAGVVVSHSILFLLAKGLHVTAYALAAILTGWLRAPSPWRWMLLAFWFLHAGATEVGQRFVPGRTGSLNDVALDHIGLLIGLALSRRWWRSTG